MKTKAPKKLYARLLANGKLSVGEYINAKWNNVVPPFRVKDWDPGDTIRTMAQNYRRKTKREIIVEGYRGDIAAEQLLIDILK